MHSMLRRLTAGCLIVFALAFAVSMYWMQQLKREPRFRAVHRGQPISDVLKDLGPCLKVHRLDDPSDLSYREEGWSFRPFKETGAVYVFARKAELLYVLVRDGKVVDLFIAIT